MSERNDDARLQRAMAEVLRLRSLTAELRRAPVAPVAVVATASRPAATGQPRRLPREVGGPDDEARDLPATVLSMLEAGWEAVERAGARPGPHGPGVGVYLGVPGGPGPTRPADLGAAPAARLAHLLDLRGPGVTLDAGPASALVAVDGAVGALRRGTCSASIAGGAEIDGSCGLLVLKLLADAERDGDRVLAVVRGSVVERGAPAGDGALRLRMVAEVRSASEIEDEVDLVADAGTAGRPGSGAVASLIETVRGLHPRRTPTGGERGRPCRAAVAWCAPETSAAVVLEEPSAVVRDPDARPAAACPVVVSGRDDAEVREQARGWLRWWLDPKVTLPDVAVTAMRRTHHRRRAGFVAASEAAARAALSAVGDGIDDGGVVRADARPRSGAVFVFPGQGGDWPGMAGPLLDTSEVFAAAMAECDAALRPFVGWSVLARLRDGARPLEGVDVLQPALFAMYVSLAAVWRAHGVEPAAVVGHSQGELAAAVVAGALTLDQAAMIIGTRSGLLAAEARGGEMAVIGLPEAAVTARIADRSDRISVAAVNTSRLTTVSGAKTAIEDLLVELDDEDVVCGKIHAAVASHSPLMDALEHRLLDAFRGITPAPGGLPFCSALLGGFVDGTRLDATYWWRNLREPVQFERAQAALMDRGYDVFVEIGPHPILSSPLTENGAGREIVVVPTLRRGHGGSEQYLAGLVALHVHGYDVDWTAVRAADARIVDLPLLPFPHTSPPAGAEAVPATPDKRNGHADRAMR